MSGISRLGNRILDNLGFDAWGNRDIIPQDFNSETVETNQEFQPGTIDMSKIKNLVVDTITVSSTGYIRSGKTSFTDSVNAGYYFSADGIYIGAAGDASKLLYKISDGSFDFVGTHSAGSVGGIAIGDIVNVTTPTADAVPTGLTASATGITTSSNGTVSAYVTLTWNAIATTTFDHYQIRYKKASYVFYQYIDAKTNTITIDGLSPNVSYNFGISSVNKAGVSSAFSADISQTTATNSTPPATTAGVSATGGIQYVIITWTSNSEADLASYNIYRNTSNDSGTAVLIGNSFTNYFIDGNLTGGTPYYYWIKAVNTSGYASVNFSTVQTATPRNVASSDNNIANQGWTQTCAFSTTDADTVAWGAGVFTASNGTSYNITAGNTGNMSARTYIYLDIAISTTAYQTTTTATTAVGDGKVLIATAKNNTVVGATECTFQVFGGAGGVTIDGGDIIAESITTNEIAANTIEAGNIKAGTITATEIDTTTITSLSNLSIAASQVLIDGAVYLSNWRAGTELTKIDGGNLYVGSQITIGATSPAPLSGHIKSGQTDYNTGIGWWIGSVAGTPKFSIGNPADAYLTYDGGTGVLALKGSVTITGGSGIANLTDAGALATRDTVVFVAEPTTPYYVGDLWTDGTFLKKCKTQKLTGAYDAANWELATNYTDDTTANLKTKTFYQAAIPTSLTIGDLWIDSDDNNKLYEAESVGADEIKAGEWVEVPTSFGNLSNIPGTLATPSGTGLFLSSTYLGYYDSPNWKTYMDSSGNFYLGGTSGPLQWVASTSTLLLGNWNFDTTKIYKDGATDATSAGMAPADFPFYAGKKYADRATAPFRVTPAGDLTASSATITGALTTAAGSTINGTYVDSLNVSKLAAGTITSKTITLAVSAGTGDTYIAAGKTDFTNTDAGFILGIDDSDSDRAKFYIGNSTEYLSWNGVTLDVSGPFFEVLASDTLRTSADTEGTSYNASYTKVKEIEYLDVDGTVRIKFDGAQLSSGGTAFFKVYINGTGVGTQRTSGGGYATFSEDFSVSNGDLLQLYVYTGNINHPASYKNFRVYYDKQVTPKSNTVNLN